MPHAISPESSPAPDETMISQVNVNALEDEEMLDANNDTEENTAPSSNPVQDIDAASQDKAQLEAMFDDDDDEDFPSSNEAPAFKPSVTASHADPEVMKVFYQRLFPFRYLFQWLNHSPTPSNDFAHREFAFTLQNDIYLRYQSFTTADLYVKQLISLSSTTNADTRLKKQCVAQNPTRFEIGPVYSTNPRDRKTLRRAAAFKPIMKELVFDIDMDAYDEIRTCCTGANICHRCWSFIKMAVKVVNTALEEDFGFKHVLWVYSGRRGIHGWVCDRKARELDDAKRRSIANYMDLIKGGDSSGKKVNIRRPLHPHIDRSLRILRDNFQSDILKEQDPWQEEEKARRLLALLPDKQLAQSLAKKWESAPSRSSFNKWADIDTLASSGGGSNTLDTRKLLEAKQDIVLEYTYPRLDAEVSKHLNHLLKSPFCVHPKTGRICVPVDPSKIDDFDPFEVPTVTELLRQIDEWQEAHKDEDSNSSRVQDWEKTRLKPYVDYFRLFVAALIKEEQGGKRRREDANEGVAF